jgi:ribosomal protein S18 acetylase RimI-like enzyme
MDADTKLGSLLAARGWTQAPEPAYTHWHQSLDPRGAADTGPAVPSGYGLRHVVLPDDVAGRVEVHRAAFAPSRMTADWYRTLATMPLYAPEHDLVVEAPDGSFAAFALVWWVPASRMGEFEPVGTHPDHQRLGLARAVNLAGLRLLRHLGARDALVFSRTSNAASEALYESVGFQAVTRHRAWTHPLG